MSLRWGVLSTARIGRSRFVPGVRRDGQGEVLAMSSRHTDVRSVAEAAGVPRSYVGHDALLADPDVDAVYVALPNALHRDWVIRAADAGKHVVCEKPLVSTAAELAQVREACERAGVALMEAFMYRHHPQHHLLGELMAERAVGEIRGLHGSFHFPLDRTQDDIRLDPALGGGSLNDVGCYLIDAAVAAMGREPDDVHVVGHVAATGVDTHAAGLLSWGDVAFGFDCGFDGPAVNRWTVRGSEGDIELDRAFDPPLDEVASVTVRDRAGALVSQRTLQTDQFALGVGAFEAFVAGGGRGLMDRALVEGSLATRTRALAALHPAHRRTS